MEQTLQKKNITDILNTEYKAYARYSVESRAIPHFADGLKPVQRKALAAGIRFCENRTINVSALAGKVKGDFDYHHGDSSCQGAIVVMAQDFQQAMPYFDRIGQFGFLYDKTPGAARYISVKLSGWSKLVLKDDAELKYNLHEDTGEQIEPKYYLPILPMLLINGTDGIAVGYSTSFVNRNPLEVALAVREYLATGKLPEYHLTPFVHGHTGLWSFWNGQFEHCAPWHRKNNTVLSIDGLPMNTTLEKYRGYLNELVDQGQIKNWYDLSSKGKTVFEVHMASSYLDQLVAENGIAGMFRLIYRLPQDNLTCVMPNNAIKRFDTPCQVIREFVDFRLKVYFKRKQRLIRDIEHRLAYLQSLVRFIDLVNDGTITFKGRTKRDLEAQLAELQIDKAVLNVQVYNLSEDNKQKHLNEIAKLTKDLQNIQNTTEQQMYINDIDEVLVHIKKYYVIEPVLNLKQEDLRRIA